MTHHAPPHRPSWLTNIGSLIQPDPPPDGATAPATRGASLWPFSQSAAAPALGAAAIEMTSQEPAEAAGSRGPHEVTPRRGTCGRQTRELIDRGLVSAVAISVSAGTVVMCLYVVIVMVVFTKYYPDKLFADDSYAARWDGP